MQITSLHSLNAFLLPIKTVGVQVTLTGTRWSCLVLQQKPHRFLLTQASLVWTLLQ